MQAAPARDPGFSQRRVKRQNPMDQWDAEPDILNTEIEDIEE